jgi:glycosyltransferase involved in cell wall biosynthesis
MKYPKISIVTVSYNQVDYLEQTLRSVLDQNYPNLEYVVIDGGSTDGSVDIIKKYADKLTYWVSEKDAGQYDGINKGFAHTTGDIMAWINSSDLYYPWTLRFIAEIFENLPEVQWLSGMPTNLSTGVAPQRIVAPKERNLYDIVCGDYRWIQQESIFWKRSVWEKAGGKLDTAVRYAGDLNLWIQFYKHTHLYYVNTILGGFRYHDVRRGGVVGGPYVDESVSVYKAFKAQASSKIRLRAFIAGMFFRKSRFIQRVIKKLGWFSWYRHHTIFYDFETEKWVVEIH